ncbi:hypothetical protein QOZ80_2AG0118620 [Eleusine coracana subsp. coracana]|nr:hypothetical protein QOZ80_2AG0118620 [Eleusine coracana subsp. coracana]
MRPALAASSASTGGLHLALPAVRMLPPPPQGRSIIRGTGRGRLRAAAAPPQPPPPPTPVVLLGRPLESVYKVRVERGATAAARVEALRVMETWSSWRTGGRCVMPWDWQVDQLVYIVSGEVKVIPAGAVHGDQFMHFVAGDLVRYPRWFEADLHFEGPYEERYKFLAYGDDN